jgi:thioredoxin-dependent peroxiredoxin
MMAVRLVGEIVPDFALLSTMGARVRVSDYRGKRNIILIFCGAGRSKSVRSLVRQVSELYAEFVAEEAEVFAVVRGAGGEAEDLKCNCDPPFPVLVDRENRAHDLFGSPASGQDFLPLVCIVDRYGEVRHISRAGEPEASFGAPEILDWVRYINLECPE